MSAVRQNGIHSKTEGDPNFFPFSASDFTCVRCCLLLKLVSLSVRGDGWQCWKKVGQCCWDWIRNLLLTITQPVRNHWPWLDSATCLISALDRDGHGEEQKWSQAGVNANSCVTCSSFYLFFPNPSHIYLSCYPTSNLSGLPSGNCCYLNLY